jgi:sugar-specific transcriptional regulator TrmB
LSLEESQLNGLLRLGLTEYEFRLYLVLVKMGPIKASELSFRAQILEQKSTEQLTSSSGRGCSR